MRWLLIALLLFSQTLWAQNIEKVEYFFDEDPGFGKATAIETDAPNQTLFEAQLPVDHLSNGVHMVYVRALNDLGDWTNTFANAFVKGDLPYEHLPNVVVLEYFIDEDPGFGKGIAIDFEPSDSVNIDYTIDLSELENGVHNAYFRAQDALGNWNSVLVRPFIVGINIPDVTYVEYFIDTDPGFGNATPIEFVQFNTVNLAVDLDIASVSNGSHTLAVRARDANGAWSETFLHAFFKENIAYGETSEVVYAEYFIDEDPGYGAGTSIVIPENSDSLMIDFIAELNDFAMGDHVLYVRVQNDAGSWSTVYSNLFEVCNPAAPPSLPEGTIELCVNSDNTTYTTNVVADAIDYDWQLLPEEAGVITGNDTTAVVDWDDTYLGEASIIVAGINDCGVGLYSDTLSVLIDICDGIDTFDALSFSVYPNPATSSLQIEPSIISEPSNLRIFDTQGKMHYATEITPHNGAINVAVQQFPKGIYFVQLLTESQSKIQKVVIE